MRKMVLKIELQMRSIVLIKTKQMRICILNFQLQMNRQTNEQHLSKLHAHRHIHSPSENRKFNDLNVGIAVGIE